MRQDKHWCTNVPTPKEGSCSLYRTWLDCWAVETADSGGRRRETRDVETGPRRMSVFWGILRDFGAEKQTGTNNVWDKWLNREESFLFRTASSFSSSCTGTKEWTSVSNHLQLSGMDDANSSAHWCLDTYTNTYTHASTRAHTPLL